MPFGVSTKHSCVSSENQVKAQKAFQDAGTVGPTGYEEDGKNRERFDETDFPLVRTEGEEHPVVWVGPDDGTITILCKGRRRLGQKEFRWDLSLRDSIYEEGDNSLVGISGKNGSYEGDLLFQAERDGNLVATARVIDREKAVDEKSGGFEWLPLGKAKGLFFRLLKKHPKLQYAFQEKKYEASAFVSDGTPNQPVPVFARGKNGTPAVWAGGGSLNGNVKGIVVCTENFELRRSLKVRETGFTPSFKQVLLRLGQGDLVFHVDGSLPLEKSNLSLNVEVSRVGDPWEATCSESGGSTQLSDDKARRLFFQLLEEQPDVKRALQTCKSDGDAFAGYADTDLGKSKGSVKFFDGKKNYGFIEPDWGSEDVFVYIDDVDEASDLTKEDRVEFIPTRSKEGLQAKHVKVIDCSHTTGTIDWFDEDKNYGFIENEELEKDVFVHGNDLETNSLSEGDKVEFTTIKNEQGLKAVNVILA